MYCMLFLLIRGVKRSALQLHVVINTTATLSCRFAYLRALLSQKRALLCYALECCVSPESE